MGFLDRFIGGPPNVNRLAAKRDITGLLKALEYAIDRPIRKGEDYDMVKKETIPIALSATSALAEIQEPRAIEPFLQFVRENDVNFGNEFSPLYLSPVPRILAKFGNTAVEPLLLWLERAPFEKAIAATALGFIADSRAKGPLIKISHECPMAVWALGNLCETQEDVETILSFLEHSDHWFQRRAYEALSMPRMAHVAANSLVALCKLDISQETDYSKKEKKRRAKYLAGLALCNLGDPRGLEWMLEHATGAGFWLIGNFNDPRVAKKLSDYLQKTEPKLDHIEDQSKRGFEFLGEEWVFCALGLAKMKDIRAIRPLLKIMSLPQSASHIYWLFEDSYYNLAVNALQAFSSELSEPLATFEKVFGVQISNTAEAEIRSNIELLNDHGIALSRRMDAARALTKVLDGMSSTMKHSCVAEFCSRCQEDHCKCTPCRPTTPEN